MSSKFVSALLRHPIFSNLWDLRAYFQGLETTFRGLELLLQGLVKLRGSSFKGQLSAAVFACKHQRARPLEFNLTAGDPLFLLIATCNANLNPPPAKCLQSCIFGMNFALELAKANIWLGLLQIFEMERKYLSRRHNYFPIGANCREMALIEARTIFGLQISSRCFLICPSTQLLQSINYLNIWTAHIFCVSTQLIWEKQFFHH